MQALSDPKAIKLAEYMKMEFGVTPDNIDEKLEQLKKEYYKKMSRMGGGETDGEGERV